MTKLLKNASGRLVEVTDAHAVELLDRRGHNFSEPSKKDVEKWEKANGRKVTPDPEPETPADAPSVDEVADESQATATKVAKAAGADVNKSDSKAEKAEKVKEQTTSGKAAQAANTTQANTKPVDDPVNAKTETGADVQPPSSGADAGSEEAPENAGNGKAAEQPKAPEQSKVSQASTPKRVVKNNAK